MQSRILDLPPLDLLASFDAAARHASFTLAGAELHLTQSAVSRQIQTLEAALGVALFDRHHRRIVLTVAGRQYAHTVAGVLATLREATRQLARAGGARTVTVGTTLTLASLWLVPRLASFQRLHPQIEIRVAASNEIQDLPRAGLDLAIRYCPAAQAGPDGWLMFGEATLPVASPKLVTKPLTHPADIARYTLLHFDDPQSRFPWLSWQVWLELHRVDLPPARGALRFSHYDQMIHAAIDGQGIALGRRPLVDDGLKSGRLIAPFGKR